jgi:hypothetical protein
MWPDSYEMYRKLINVDKDGSRREFVMYTIKQGRDKVASVFLKPPEDEGRVLLRIGDNMWMRLPDVLQPLRVASMHSTVGGIFNNWDLMRTELAADYDVDSAKEDLGSYRLSLKRKNDWAIYEKLELSVDKEHLLPQWIEAYVTSGTLIKTVTFEDIKDFGDGVVRPATVETTSPLWPGVSAVMMFGKIRKREFSDEVFTVNNMANIGDLRR